MGQALKDNQTFDPLALFMAKRLRNQDYPPIETDWLDHVEKHDEEAEIAKSRNMLATFKSFDDWSAGRNPTPKDIELARRVFNEIVKLACLSEHEECAVRAIKGWSDDGVA